MQRYEEFLGYANAGTKFIKILKIIFTITIPLATFPENIDTFLRKLTDGTFVHKVHKVHRLFSKDALPPAFSVITPYF